MRPHAPSVDGSGGASISGQPGRRLAETALGALPPLFPTLGGALLWGLAMGGSALGTLLLAQWETPQKVREVVLLFAIGGAVAFPLGLFLARLLSTAGRRETAFAAMLLSLAIATIAVTSGLLPCSTAPTMPNGMLKPSPGSGSCNSPILWLPRSISSRFWDFGSILPLDSSPC